MAIPKGLVVQTKTLQIQTSQIATRTALKALPDLSKLSRREAGGVLRTVATGTVAQFGNVATQSARISYDTMRTAAKVKGSKYAAMALNFKAGDLADPAVGLAMSVLSQERAVEEVTSVFTNVLDKAIGDIFRETIANAVNGDPQATGYQRIASPDACAFCSMVCLNEYTSFGEDGGYHDNCGCTTVPIFKGQDSYRPDYYDKFEQELVDAYAFKRSEDFKAPSISHLLPGAKNGDLSQVDWKAVKWGDVHNTEFISALRQVSGRD